MKPYVIKGRSDSPLKTAERLGFDKKEARKVAAFARRLVRKLVRR